MTIQSQIQLFGEVLFDHFPDGSRVLGGAPFNVAWHLQALGCVPNFVSRVGDDKQGREILQAMRQWGMSPGGMQIDETHPTGCVQVTLQGGEPCYEIIADCAYDFINSRQLAPEVTEGVLYHGTLALRHPVALEALQALKARHQGRIFIDVNLRAPWWREQAVSAWLQDADWVKLNQDELAQLSEPEVKPEEAMQVLRERYDLETVVVTCGEKGALACNRQGDICVVEPAPALTVVDTVGAGDAFAAVLLLGMLQDWSLSIALQRAQTLASALVGRRGATVFDPDFYRVIAKDWH